MISKGCESLIKRAFPEDKASSILLSLSQLTAAQVEDPELERTHGSSFNPRVCRLIEIAIKHFSMKNLDTIISLSRLSTRELLKAPLDPELAAICFLDAVRHLHMSKTLPKADVLLKFSEAINSLSDSIQSSFFKHNLKRFEEKYT